MSQARNVDGPAGSPAAGPLRPAKRAALDPRLGPAATVAPQDGDDRPREEPSESGVTTFLETYETSRLAVPAYEEGELEDGSIGRSPEC